MKGYMCKIAFDHELGHDIDGTKVYPTIEALANAHPTVDDQYGRCGIVEVEVTRTDTVK